MNLGNPNEITVMQLAEEIIALVPDTKSKIIYEDLPQDDPKRRKPDITRAKTLLGLGAGGRSRRRPEALARVFSRGRLIAAMRLDASNGTRRIALTRVAASFRLITAAVVRLVAERLDRLLDAREHVPEILHLHRGKELFHLAAQMGEDDFAASPLNPPCDGHQEAQEARAGLSDAAQVKNELLVPLFEQVLNIPTGVDIARVVHQPAEIATGRRRRLQSGC